MPSYKLSPRRESDPERTLEEIQHLLPPNARILEVSDTLVQYDLPTQSKDAALRSRIKVIPMPKVEDDSRTTTVVAPPPIQVSESLSIYDLNYKVDKKDVSGQAEHLEYTPRKKSIGILINKLLLEEYGLRLYMADKRSNEFQQHLSDGRVLCTRLGKLLKKSCDPVCTFPKCLTAATQGDFCSPHFYRVRNLVTEFDVDPLVFLPSNSSKLYASKVIDACMPTARRMFTPDGKIDAMDCAEKILYFVGKQHEWFSVAEHALVIQKRYPEYTIKLVIYKSFSPAKQAVIVKHLPNTLKVAFLN